MGLVRWVDVGVDAAFHVVDGHGVDKLGWNGVWRNSAGNGDEMIRQ